MSYVYHFKNDKLIIHCGDITKAELNEFIANRKEDILSKYEEHQKIRDSIHRPSKFVTGELVSFLGDTLTLRVEKSVANSVELTQDEIILNVTDPTKSRLCKEVYDEWKAERLTDVVHKLAPSLFAKLSSLGAPIPRRIICTKLSTYRAGECWHHMDADGPYDIIKLDIRLLELPIETINAVLAHECAHTTHHNHRKPFWAHLSELCPGWGVWDKYTFEKWTKSM